MCEREGERRNVEEMLTAEDKPKQALIPNTLLYHAELKVAAVSLSYYDTLHTHQEAINLDRQAGLGPNQITTTSQT